TLPFAILMRMKQQVTVLQTILAMATTFATCSLAYGFENHDVWQKVEGNRRLSAINGSSFAESDAEVQIKGGGFLIESDGKTLLKTDLAEIKPESRSLLFVRAQPECQHIFLLLGSAAVSCKSVKTGLRPGEEAIVA